MPAHRQALAQQAIAIAQQLLATDDNKAPPPARNAGMNGLWWWWWWQWRWRWRWVLLPGWLSLSAVVGFPHTHRSGGDDGLLSVLCVIRRHRARWLSRPTPQATTPRDRSRRGRAIAARSAAARSGGPAAAAAVAVATAAPATATATRAATAMRAATATATPAAAARAAAQVAPRPVRVLAAAVAHVG